MQNPENQSEVASSHMGIKDFLKRGSNIDVATKNIMNVANECKNYGIKKIFVSGLTINNNLHSDFIKAVNSALKLDCVKYAYNFIENSSILNNSEQFLNNSGKSKLLNNFLVSLNNFFLSKLFIQ